MAVQKTVNKDSGQQNESERKGHLKLVAYCTKNCTDVRPLQMIYIVIETIYIVSSDLVVSVAGKIGGPATGKNKFTSRNCFSISKCASVNIHIREKLSMRNVKCLIIYFLLRPRHH